MEPSFILTYILIALSLIIGPMVIVMLYKMIRILSKIEKTMLFVDHVRDLLETWERLPMELVKKCMNFWTK